MYEKNGVITEERFQKLTSVQWLFHYHEIMKQRDKKVDEKVDIIKAITETINTNMDLMGLVINPDRGSKLIDLKKEEKQKQELIKNGGTIEDEISMMQKEFDKAPSILSADGVVTDDKKPIIKYVGEIERSDYEESLLNDSIIGLKTRKLFDKNYDKITKEFEIKKKRKKFSDKIPALGIQIEEGE